MLELKKKQEAVMGLFSFLFGKKKKTTEEAKPQFNNAQIEADNAKSTLPSIEAQESVTECAEVEVAFEESVLKEEETVTVQAQKEKKSRVGKFEIKKTKDDRYVFNLYASNNVIIATSQIYSSAQGAINGINSIITNSAKAEIEDQTLKSYEELPYPKWEIYSDNAGQYRFRLNATNGSCVCHSQGYTTKLNCKKGIESIINTSKNAEIVKAYLKK
jgi:uncharacterized protein YegP (UPF0339 family)